MVNEYNTTNISTYLFTVNIISGRLKGKIYKGFFSYDSSQLNSIGEERLSVEEFMFDYQGVFHTNSSFGSLPQVVFNNGKFQFLEAIGILMKRRFGFNAGFKKSQFSRDEEAFVRAGEGYFAYLDPDTFVEGAGTITYTFLPPGEQLEPQESCINIDYTQLCDFLKEKEWKLADRETGRIILQTANQLNQLNRDHLTDDDIENFPHTVLQIIDNHWLNYSEGLFGLSVQKHIWQEPDIDEEFLKFSTRVGWILGGNLLDYDKLEFSLNAPMGHLPLGGRWINQEDWIDLLPFNHTPLWISSCSPFIGRLKEKYLLRTLWELID
jgi:hypothetical protein